MYGASRQFAGTAWLWRGHCVAYFELLYCYCNGYYYSSLVSTGFYLQQEYIWKMLLLKWAQVSYPTVRDENQNLCFAADGATKAVIRQILY